MCMLSARGSEKKVCVCVCGEWGGEREKENMIKQMWQITKSSEYGYG